MEKQGVSKEIQHCIDACLACERSCSEMVPHCLKKGGKHAEPDHIRLMLDCADICGTSARFMMRQSSIHGLTCSACAEVCERCAEDCAKFKDPTMDTCAEACRACAEACRAAAPVPMAT